LEEGVEGALWLRDQGTLVQFYDKLFTKQFSWWPKLDGLPFDFIEEVEASWLVRLFEENEVLKVVKGMNSDKVPGLDGFTMAFFQLSWDMIKEDIMGCSMIFMLEASLKKIVNVTFIALILKKV
jgi:hypothetical protein